MLNACNLPLLKYSDISVNSYHYHSNPLHLFFKSFINLFSCLFIYVLIYSVCFSLILSTYLFIHLFIHSFIHSFIHLSILYYVQDTRLGHCESEIEP